MNTPTNTPQPQHTPTPYSAEGRFIYSAATHYAAPEGNKIAEVIWNSEAKNSPEQDAAFIVRACNSHAQLVAALDRASMVAEYANRLSCCKTIKEATDAKLYSKLATALVEFREARAALTAAQS